MDDELKEKLENVLLVVTELDSWADHIRFNLTRLRADIKDVRCLLGEVLENEMLKDREVKK